MSFKVSSLDQIFYLFYMGQKIIENILELLPFYGEIISNNKKDARNLKLFKNAQETSFFFFWNGIF